MHEHTHTWGGGSLAWGGNCQQRCHTAVTVEFWGQRPLSFEKFALAIFLMYLRESHSSDITLTYLPPEESWGEGWKRHCTDYTNQTTMRHWCTQPASQGATVGRTQWPDRESLSLLQPRPTLQSSGLSRTGVQRGLTPRGQFPSKFKGLEKGKA